jgi:hypothetical protein
VVCGEGLKEVGGGIGEGHSRLLEWDIGNVGLSLEWKEGMEKNVCTLCVILMEDG